MELLSLNIRTALHLMHLDKCRSSRTKRCCGRYFYRFRGENETSVPYSLGCSLHTLPITLNIFILLFASIAKVRRSINCPPTLDEYMYTCISSSAYTAQTDQSTIGIHRVAPVTAGREHSVSWDVSWLLVQCKSTCHTESRIRLPTGLNDDPYQDFQIRIRAVISPYLLVNKYGGINWSNCSKNWTGRANPYRPE